VGKKVAEPLKVVKFGFVAVKNSLGGGSNSGFMAVYLGQAWP